MMYTSMSMMVKRGGSQPSSLLITSSISMYVDDIVTYDTVKRIENFGGWSLIRK